MRKLNREEHIVFDEFVQAKSWEQYISDYSGRKIDYRKCFSIATIIFATISATTWGFWKSINVEWITPLMFFLLGVSQLLTALQKETIVDEYTLRSLSRLRCLYIEYSDSLENLFLEILESNLTNGEIRKKYFELRKQTLNIQTLKDSLNIKYIESLSGETIKRVEDELAERYKDL